jgi:hypothetical protein
MWDTALARHKSLIERQMCNSIKSMSKAKRNDLKWKLEEADDSPDHSYTAPILPPPQVLETQGKPKGVGDNVMLETAI